VASSFLARPARAQDKPAPAPQPALVPPKLVTEANMPYPDGGTGPETVTLTVVVGPDGKVRSVTAEGREPFAAVAKQRAAEFEFVPASRNGTPVAAKVRLEVTFTPPVIETPPPEPEPEPAAPGAPTQPPAVEEVTVRGKRKDPPAPQMISMGKAEVRVMPGAFGDPFRAIDVLPGVVPTISGLPYYYIRGAPPGNVGYYLDGVRLPYLFHFGLGPGVINPTMIERVDLYPGAAPAQWGRYAGAIISAETEDVKKGWHATGLLRPFDVGGVASGSFAGERGQVQLGGRYSYTAALLTLFAPNTFIDYSDYQARVSYDLSPNDKLTLFSFGAFDLAGEDEEDGTRNIFFASEFHRLDLRWDRHIDKKSRLRVGTTLGLDRTRIEGARFARDWIVGARTVYERGLGEHLFRTGVDVTTDSFGGDLPSEYSVAPKDLEDARNFIDPRLDVAASAHADVILQVNSRFEVTPGFRLDVFNSKGNTAVSPSPRLSVLLKLDPRTRLTFLNGIMSQPPAFPIPVPAYGIGALKGGLQTAYHQAAGIERDLPADITGGVTVFRQSFRNTDDFFNLRNNNNGNSDDDDPLSSRRTPLHGIAYGLELKLRRPLSRRVGGMLSYTLSRNERGREASEGVSDFDRTHVFNLAISGDLGHGWRLGGRFLTYSGWPKKPDLTKPPEEILRELQGGGRLPWFYRLDVRFEKRWTIGKEGFIAVILEGLNVTLSKEVVGYNCTAVRCKEDDIGPVTIPSLGLEGGF
jgi:hypothetical protein